MNGDGGWIYHGRLMNMVKKPENRVWNPACECLPRKELEALQLKRLKKVVKTAWDKVPYYRKKMEDAGVAPRHIRSLRDVAKLPFTTKDDLRGCFPYRAFAVPMEDVVRVHA